MHTIMPAASAQDIDPAQELGNVLFVILHSFAASAVGGIVVMCMVLRLVMVVVRSRATTQTATVTAPPTSPDRARELQDYRERHNALNAKWTPYLNDPDVFLALPGMRDMSVREVGEFIDALAAADHARIDKLPKSYTKPVREHPYAVAVRDAERTFAAAHKVAVHMLETQMSASERADLDTIRQLLATARDDAGTPHERRLAYQRASRMLDQLGITLPEPARERLEASVRGLIEPAGATRATGEGNERSREHA